MGYATSMFWDESKTGTASGVFCDDLTVSFMLQVEIHPSAIDICR